MTAHRKSCCVKCSEPEWTEIAKSLPTAYSCTSYSYDICPSTMDGGNCDFTVATTASVNFDYPSSGKGACSSTEVQTFTDSCETNGDGGSPTCSFGSSVWGSADCTASCSSGTYDFGYACQSYSGSASYTNKTVSWNAPTKRTVADATVQTGFNLTWDVDKTFGGACTATSLQIKKATIEVTTASIILRLYLNVSNSVNQIWKYTINMCQEMDEFSTAVNAQTDDTETWSIGIVATDGDSSISYTGGLVAVAETEVSNGQAITLQFYHPEKVGLEMAMAFEVDPAVSGCNTFGQYTWTAQSNLVQRTTSASWDVYRCPSSDFSGSWSATGLGAKVNSATVTIS